MSKKDRRFLFETSKILYPILGIAAIIMTVLLYNLNSGSIPFTSTCEESCQSIGLGIASIINALLYILFVKWVLMVTGIGYYYRIENDGIVVCRFYRERKFLFDDISMRKILSAEQVGDLVYRINNDLLEYRNWPNLKKQFAGGWKLAMLGKYSGVVIPESQMSIDINLEKMSLPVYMKALKFNPAKGRYIFITLKNGEMYILSPKNAKEFYSMLK